MMPILMGEGLKLVRYTEYVTTYLVDSKIWLMIEDRTYKWWRVKSYGGP